MASWLDIKKHIIDPQLLERLQHVLATVKHAGGRAFLVGGCVRDMLLSKPAKDLDVEVYGLAPDALKNALSARFRIDEVGAAFAVLKIHGTAIDVSVPRRESKRGFGHKGFEVVAEPFLSPQQATARRDFTINSIMLAADTGELIDPWGGERDLHSRVLRHTSDHFAEDPLRVLRGVQFAARFDLTVAAETVALCRTMEQEQLPRERLFEEWRKLLLLGVRPSRGLEFLRQCDWVRYYPELQPLIGCQQDPQWHPEGDVWVHTLHCLDAFANLRIGDEQEDLVVGFAVLCHDLGKAATTVFADGRWRSPGHDAAGEAPTRSFLNRLTISTDFIDDVVRLVLYHMRPVELFGAEAGDGAIRRLAHRVGRIDRLIRVAFADQLGRPPIANSDFPAAQWLLERARACEIEKTAPRPLVMGRHLTQMGLSPGPRFREILGVCYEAQLNGTIKDLHEGKALAKAQMTESELQKVHSTPQLESDN